MRAKKMKKDEDGIGRVDARAQFRGKRKIAEKKANGKGPKLRELLAKQSADRRPAENYKVTLNSVQADRVTNPAGEDLNRSVGLADRGRPRECQHCPGLLSAWQGIDVCNPTFA
jgi:glycine cleavage system aminomethyltransferase T